ncbi:MAG TPA: hypothetical protein DEG71_01165 [Clostridiales bacterium]|nr:hypothetical protein [Clostridiales bacterium]
MRMHPRRYGSYNFSARVASAFTNAYFKNHKYRNNQTQTNTNDSGIIGLLIFVFIVILVAICS